MIVLPTTPILHVSLAGPLSIVILRKGQVCLSRDHSCQEYKNQIGSRLCYHRHRARLAAFSSGYQDDRVGGGKEARGAAWLSPSSRCRFSYWQGI